MKRRDFVKAVSIASLTPLAMKLNELNKITNGFLSTSKMPVLFIGHGHPINAILNNEFTQRLAKLKNEMEKPNAILMISAHWETSGTYVSTNPWPKTIYDFGNFDNRLFQIKYEPQGNPSLAREVQGLVDKTNIKEDRHMGLDHGAWTVLKHIYPKADVPVFQLSIDYNKGPSFHYSLAKQLSSLRRRGVLIMGSGNIVHNLYQTIWNDINATPHSWNLEFDNKVKNMLNQHRFDDLVEYQKLGAAARLSIPTNEHYLPMIYTLGLAESDDEIEHIYEGYQYAGLSMRCFKIG